MKRFNLALLFLVLLVCGSSLVMANSHGTFGTDFDLGEIIGDIASFGALEWLFGSGADSQFVGFLRVIMAILAFTIIYYGLSFIPNINRNIAVAIGILLAIMSAVFTPGNVLMAAGVAWGSILAFIVVFGPVITVLVILFATPTPWWAAIIKLFALGALTWILGQISYWANYLQTIT